MKTEIRLPQAGVDANIQVYDANGRPIAATIGRIVIEPIFNQTTQQVPLLYGRSYVEVVDEDAKEDAPPKEENVQRFLVQVGGTSGKAKMSDKSQQVTPQFEAKRKKALDANKLDPVRPKKPKGGNPDPELASLPTES